MIVPRATYTRAGDVRLAFPFNRRLVNAIKTGIPGYARSYDPTRRVWTVRAAYAARAVELLRASFPDAHIEQPGARPRPAPHHRVVGPFAVLHLLPTAPPALVDAAYRTLARLCHPDVGGTDAAMRALNDARDALKERVAG